MTQALFPSYLLKFRFCLIACMLSSLLWVFPVTGYCASGVQQKLPPGLSWQALKSHHFHIYFVPQQKNLAHAFSQHFEAAYERLSESLQWRLTDPVEILLRPDRDVHGGHAEVFPGGRIVIHALPFFPHGALGEYDNWMRILAYHELTHLIASDPSSGAFRFLRTLFGSIAQPNSYLPPWMTEGLAVYEETRYSSAGRGRSAYLDTFLRAAVRDQLFENGSIPLGLSFDRISEGAPRWPAEATPYLLGYLMVEWMALKAGDEAIAKLTHRLSGRFPFFVDGAASSVGEEEGFLQLWQEMQKAVKDWVQQDLKKIDQQELSVFQDLAKSKQHGRWSGGAALGPEKKHLYFIRDSYDTGQGISRLDLANKQIKNLSHWNWSGRRQLRQQSGFLLYSQVRPFEEYAHYADLYIYDLKKNEEFRLTRGLRAMDGDFSPDFKWDEDEGVRAGQVIYVKTLSSGNQGIALWNGKQEKVIYRGSQFERLSGCAWGKGFAKEWIAFSRKRNDEAEQLLALHTRSGTIRELTPRNTQQKTEQRRHALWDEKGNLYFVALAWRNLQSLFVTASAASAILRACTVWRLSFSDGSTPHPYADRPSISFARTRRKSILCFCIWFDRISTRQCAGKGKIQASGSA